MQERGCVVARQADGRERLGGRAEAARAPHEAAQQQQVAGGQRLRARLRQRRHQLATQQQAVQRARSLPKSDLG